MNRTALSIKMLQILYGRTTPISRDELADILETNKRNISEFKRELEIAGYRIYSISGRYGGYILDKNSIFPSLHLNDKEKESLLEALVFLKKQKSFQQYQNFESAIAKFISRDANVKVKEDVTFIMDYRKDMSENETNMLLHIKEAIHECNVLTFEYLSNNATTFEKRKIQPYGCVVNEEGCYVLGYDMTLKKSHTYKYFKIIDNRMKNLIKEVEFFKRDRDFKITDHIGKHGLMKDVIEVELEITGLHARLLNEKEVENMIEKKYEKGILYLRFMMEGNMRLKNFILSMGKDCRVLSPQHIQQGIYDELKESIRQYDK